MRAAAISSRTRPSPSNELPSSLEKSDPLSQFPWIPSLSCLFHPFPVPFLFFLQGFPHLLAQTQLIPYRQPCHMVEEALRNPT